MIHVIANLPKFVQLLYVGMVLHQIHLKIAIAHSVNIYLSAYKAIHLTTKHVIVNQLKSVLKIFVGMVLNVILKIIAIVPSA